MVRVIVHQVSSVICAVPLRSRHMLAYAGGHNSHHNKGPGAAGVLPTQQLMPAASNNVQAQDAEAANAVAHQCYLQTACKDIQSPERGIACASVAVTLHTHKDHVELELMPASTNQLPAAGTASLPNAEAADKAVPVRALTLAPACWPAQVVEPRVGELDSSVQADSKVSHKLDIQAIAFMDTQRPPLLDTQVC